MKRNNLIKTIALALTVSSIGFVTPKEANAVTSGWQLLNGNYYYFSSEGKATTGWIKDGKFWYYLQPSGIMATGWQKINGNWFYFWSTGQMAASTTIEGWTADANGICTLQNRGNLSGQDVTGNHHIREDIASSQADLNAQNQLTTYNLSLSDSDKSLVKSIGLGLSRGRITIDEVKNNCIGKIVNGYKITDIIFYDQSFKNITTGTNIDQKIKAIQNSSLATYKSSSSYKFDGYFVFTCGNSKTYQRSDEWEAMRVVVEFEAE